MSHASATFEARLAMHAALAEPHRLAICDALALSDRSPSELATTLGIGSNLLAHHLQVLEAAGLVDIAPSEGDRRRRYVHLRPVASERAAPPRLAPRSVLFVCRQNSARSQFAAALWRRASTIPVDSAGTQPAPRVNSEARRAARRHGLDLSGATPRGIDTVRRRPDLLVTVCDEANEEVAMEGRLGRLHWSIPDPARHDAPSKFDRAFEAIQARIETLLRSAASA